LLIVIKLFYYIVPSSSYRDAFQYGINESNKNNAASRNFSENQTRAQVAKYVSSYGKKISHATLAKEEKVYDAAQQDPTTFGQLWTDLNSGKISSDKAYTERIKEIANARGLISK
jgi:hypothetical protein